MSFYGFNLGRLVKQAKPKKPFSKRTGLFDRQLKDDLTEDYHLHHSTDDKVTPSKSVTKNKKRNLYKGISDNIIEIIIAVLILLLIFSILARLEFLARFF